MGRPEIVVKRSVVGSGFGRIAASAFIGSLIIRARRNECGPAEAGHYVRVCTRYIRGTMADHGPIFAAMLEEFDEAAHKLNLDRGIWEILTHPKRQIIVSCPVQMDNGAIQVFTGYRVQYNITLGPAKGGIRYHPNVSLDEVTTLAAWMTWKFTVALIPFVGGRGVRIS